MSGGGNGTHVTVPGVKVWNPESPWGLVSTRFNQSFSEAQAMMNRLVGGDGQSGFLGDLRQAISKAPAVSVPRPGVSAAVQLHASSQQIPTFCRSSLDSIPNQSIPMPVLDTLPGVDPSMAAIAPPDPIQVALNWQEQALPREVFDQLLASLRAALQNGATGITPEVEQAIYQRARHRQQAESDAAYARLNKELFGRHFQYPSGALLSAITEIEAVGLRQEAEINNNIITTQADLQQKFAQFVYAQMVALEQLIRQTHTEVNSRALEASRAILDAGVQEYGERVRAYIAQVQAEETKVRSAVEVLKGAIESNRAKVDIYRAQHEGLTARIQAAAASNKSITDVYVAEVGAFEAVERAVSERNKSEVEAVKAKVEAARLDLEAAIEEVKARLAGYTAESSIGERISSDLAHIAAQVVASMMAAVNASASLGYSGNESASKSVSLSASLSESHSYEHDPVK